MEEKIGDNLVLLVSIGTLSLFTFFGGVLLFIILYQKKVIRSQKEKQDLETQFQKDMLHNFIETQEEERKRIAADLHDNVGASLAAVKMMINQIQSKDDSEKEVLDECKDIIQNTANSTREISHNLLPPSLDTLGLVKVVKRMAKNVSSDELKMKLNISSGLSLSKKVELALFRIIQEMMTNTMKYAKAKEIIVSIQQKQDKTIFKYTDNGIGFSIENSNGLGFRNIATRVQMIQAEHEFFSKPNQENGVSISISNESL
ncbi:MAG: hypothetical protein JKY48_11610 [Flavobacteriales bacterium]|nr:hypothetical protein [Flavobacteriales bacterium]